MMWDLNSGDCFFPASKEKIVQSMSSSYEDASWLSQNLPDKTYSKAGDIVAALIGNLPPIQWQRQPTEILWKYPYGSIAPGQQLVVAENQKVMMVSKGGKGCDEFPVGQHTISIANCPLLAMQSRKSLPGFSHPVLDGAPVFFSPSMEFEVGLSVMGQTHALRRVMAKGVARVRISSPKQFFEQIGQKSNFNSQSALSALQKYCDETLKKEMLAHEMDELTSNTSLLEKALLDGLRNVGLEPVNVSFSSIGEFGPGMFMPSAGQMNDPKMYEQMKQMAESMKTAQMARLQELQKMQEQQRQRAYAMSQSTSLNNRTVACPSCNASNPYTSKFCGACGKPLQEQKKTCSKCGQQSDPGIKFCGNCGSKLD